MGNLRFRQLKVTYADIAKAKGVTVHAVRQAVRRGSLDPRNLKSIAEYIIGSTDIIVSSPFLQRMLDVIKKELEKNNKKNKAGIAETRMLPSFAIAAKDNEEKIKDENNINWLLRDYKKK